MINKSRYCLYLFDFDGTIVGQNYWAGFWKNTLSAFKDGPYINPHDFDIRWSILTGRPRIDIPIIKLICSLRGLRPQHVITAPTLMWDATKSVTEHLDMKVQVISNIIHGNDPRFPDIEKIYYIDNDLEVVSTSSYTPLPDPSTAIDPLSVLSYEIRNDEVTITHCDETVNGDLVIPSSIEGITVTSISSTDYAFAAIRSDGSVVTWGNSTS